MPFGGVPVIQQINDHTVRITGVDLASNVVVPGNNGTIALAGGPAADITLPATFKAHVGSYGGNSVGLQESIDININPVSINILTNLQPSVAKTGGVADVSDFLITITNLSATLTTQTLEIVIAFRPSGVGQPSRVSP
jgi:hypothetical protein